MIKQWEVQKKNVLSCIVLGGAAVGLISCNPPNANLTFSHWGRSSNGCNSNPTNYNDLGSGTSGDPYQICDSMQILSLASQSSAWSANTYFQLMSDIDMQNTDLVGPIGIYLTNPFFGTFDGLGHTIRNVSVNTFSQSIGFFGHLGIGGTIENLTFDNLQLTGNSSLAIGAIGYNSGALINVHVFNSAVNLSNNSALTNSAGALVGLNDVTGTIDRSGVDQSSISTAGVSVSSQAGGLVGKNTGIITWSYVGQNVSVNINNGSGTGGIGGLVGVQAGQITQVFAAGTVTGNQNVGGLIGNMTGGTVAFAYASGTVRGTGTTYSTGGLIGVMTGGSLSNAFAGENSIYTPNIPSDGADYVVGEEGGAIIYPTVSYVSNINCPGSCTDNNTLTGYPSYNYYSQSVMQTQLSWSLPATIWNYSGSSYPTF